MLKKALSSSFVLVPAALFGLVVAATGCGEVTKIQECSAVIEAVNKGQDAFKIEFDEKKMEAQAKKVEDFEKAIGEVKITDAELKKSVDEYRAMVTDMAKVLRDVAKGDATILELAENRLPIVLLLGEPGQKRAIFAVHPFGDYRQRYTLTVDVDGTPTVMTISGKWPSLVAL